MKKKRIMLLMLILALIMSCVPVSAASKPAKVSNLHQVSVGPGTVKVGWNKAKKAKKYQVYVSKNGKSGNYKKVKTTKKKAYTLKGYKPGKTLWVKVRAVNGKKKGKFSKKLKVVTGRAGANFTVPIVRTFRVYLPSGYTKYLEFENNLGFKSNSTPLSFINFSAETARSLEDVKSYFAGSGSMMTYNGITGFEYDNGSGERSFSFQSGEYLYTVEATAKDPASLLHTVLQGLSW